MENIGLLIKAISSFYYVQTEEGILPCRARGKLRLDGNGPTPGDRVIWQFDHENSGIVTDISERKNYFIRPNVANVDQLVFIACSARPITDPFLIDRMSVISEMSGCRFLLCLNKNDLNSSDDLCDIYSRCKIPVLRTSAETGEGISLLKKELAGKISVLTGNSGVGKTSILNRLIPGLGEKTGVISEKHGRGKHTTRHTELYMLAEGSWIADTPGFSSLEVNFQNELLPEDLGKYFPEFPANACRFQDCRHYAEPECAVRAAVKANIIPESRYLSYLKILKDLQNPKGV